METEGVFICHCDDPPCELGVFEYSCPACKKNQTDFDVWWKQDEIWDGLHYEFKCESCGRPLVVSYNKAEYEYRVKEKTR